MIGALVARHLRQHAVLLLAVALGPALFEIVLVNAAALVESGAGFRALLGQLPAVFQETLSSYIGVLSFSSMVALGFQHPVTLAAGTAAVVVLATLPAGERDTGMLDLILSRPVSRRVYLAAVLAAVVVAALLPPAALLAGSAIGLVLVDVPGELPASQYLVATAELAVLLLAASGWTLLLACTSRRRGRAIAQSAGFALTAYILEFVAEVRQGLGWIRWASPFHYFKPIPAAVLSQWSWRDPAVLLGIFVVTVALAAWSFQRRDV